MRGWQSSTDVCKLPSSQALSDHQLTEKLENSGYDIAVEEKETHTETTLSSCPLAKNSIPLS